MKLYYLSKTTTPSILRSYLVPEPVVLTMGSMLSNKGNFMGGWWLGGCTVDKGLRSQGYPVVTTAVGT